MASVVEVNKRSVFIRIENRLLKNPQTKATKRGEVKRFTDKSQRRLARLLLNNAERFKYFFTVTYRKNNRDCMLSKKHINNFLTRFRKAVGKDIGYVWVLEFQKRGAIHFHLWLEDIRVEEYSDWHLIQVRKQIQERFKENIEDLNRFKFLTYLWLVITKQKDDLKAMKASTDLKVIYSHGFTFWYATKYLTKKGQKNYEGNIDELTGEIYDLWVGRFWGGSRCIINEKLYFSSNPKAIRIIKRWYKKYLNRKSKIGLRLLLREEEIDRISTLCDDLDRARVPKEEPYICVNKGEGLIKPIY